MTEPTGDKAAREGLLRAVQGIDVGYPLGAAVNVGQALYWACALDERRLGSEAYVAARDGDPVGRLMPGLRVARNAVTHGAAVAIFPREGLVWPLVWPLAWSGLAWASADTIVGALGRPPSRASLETYELHIAGRPVEPMMQQVLEWWQRTP